MCRNISRNVIHKLRPSSTCNKLLPPTFALETCVSMQIIDNSFYGASIKKLFKNPTNTKCAEITHEMLDISLDPAAHVINFCHGPLPLETCASKQIIDNSFHGASIKKLFKNPTNTKCAEITHETLDI